MFVVFIAFLALSQTECEEALKPVASALRQNQPASAASLLDSLRDKCSRSSAFHEFAGITSSLNGNFHVAADDFASAFALSPRLAADPKLVLWYGQALLETNQSARFITFLSVHQHAPAPPAMLFSLGTLFAKHADYRQAAKYFRQIPADSADDAVYFNIGLSYSHLLRFDDARKFYFLAIDNHAGHIDAYFHIGVDFATSGDSRKSVPWLFRAHALAPTRPDIAYVLIEQLLLLKYFETAQEITSEVLDANPSDPLLAVAKGDLLMAQGDALSAATAFEAALSREPQLPSAHLGLARVAFSQNNLEEVRKQLLIGISLAPEDPGLNGELGSLEAEQNNWNAAYTHFSKSWSSGHSNPAVALGLARALQHLNRAAEALRLLQSITTLLNSSTAFHFELAQLYAQLGNTTAAQTERQRFAELQAQSQSSLRFDDPKTYAH